jgi:hypothetical protein
VTVIDWLPLTCPAISTPEELTDAADELVLHAAMFVMSCAVPSV